MDGPRHRSDRSDRAAGLVRLRRRLKVPQLEQHLPLVPAALELFPPLRALLDPAGPSLRGVSPLSVGRLRERMFPFSLRFLPCTPVF